MTTIALLGTGLLGAGMVENMLQKGLSVRVWNRSPNKIQPLLQLGAVAAASPADAVRGAERVHLVLAEDNAVDNVIDRLQPGLGKDVPLLDHSTNLPQRVKMRYAALRSRGIRYLPAPVFMSPQNARDASGLMLLAGPIAEHEALAVPLQSMTGKLLYVGERSDLAAVYKLAGNSMFFALASALADVFAIGAGNDVSPEQMMVLFETFKPGSALPFLGQRIANAGTGKASFELAMARKDARLMIETAGQAPLLLLPTIAAAMDLAIAKGHGQADYSIFTKR